MTIYDPQNGNLHIAEQYHEAGLNIIPIRCDGSKKPTIRWKEWIDRPYPSFTQHFVSKGRPQGIAIVCGVTSGNLEGIDFDHRCDDVFPRWRRMVLSEWWELDICPIVETPRGRRHVYYRCENIEGNQVLARTKNGEDIIVETRGHGGYIIAPGSPPSVHPTGKPCRLLQGDLCNIPTITPEQRELMLNAARTFNEYVPKPKPRPKIKTEFSVDASTGERPGDIFNRETTWTDVLEPHGWTIHHTRGDVTYWRKPESYGNEHHATTGYGGTDLLYVFSTSAPPFETETTYSKFAAYAHLNHDGHFGNAASELSRTSQTHIHLLWEEHEQRQYPTKETLR